MKSITTVGRHCVSNLYCRIRSEGLVHDAERDLLAIAKFLSVVFRAIVTKIALCATFAMHRLGIILLRFCMQFD